MVGLFSHELLFRCAVSPTEGMYLSSEEFTASLQLAGKILGCKLEKEEDYKIYFLFEKQSREEAILERKKDLQEDASNKSEFDDFFITAPRNSIGTIRRSGPYDVFEREFVSTLWLGESAYLNLQRLISGGYDRNCQFEIHVTCFSGSIDESYVDFDVAFQSSRNKPAFFSYIKDFHLTKSLQRNA